MMMINPTPKTPRTIPTIQPQCKSTATPVSGYKMSGGNWLTGQGSLGILGIMLLKWKICHDSQDTP